MPFLNARATHVKNNDLLSSVHITAASCMLSSARLPCLPVTHSTLCAELLVRDAQVVVA